MVNVTHDADYRRSWNHIVLILFILFEEFCDHVYFFLFLGNDIKAKCDLLCLVKVDLLVYGYHDAFHEKFLNDHRWLHLHSVRKLTDGKLLRNGDLLDLRFLLFLLRLWIRFLKRFRDSGIRSASTLIWSASALAAFLEIFLLVLVLSVTLTLAVLGCLGQLRSKYGIGRTAFSLSRTCSALAAAVLTAETVISASSAFRTSTLAALATVCSAAETVSAISAFEASALTALATVCSTAETVSASSVILTWSSVSFTLSCRTSLTILGTVSTKTVSTVSSSLEASSVTVAVSSSFRTITLRSSALSTVCSALRVSLLAGFVISCTLACRTLSAVLGTCRSLSLACCRFSSSFTAVAGILCMEYTDDIFFLFRCLRLVALCVHRCCLFFCFWSIQLSILLLSRSAEFIFYHYYRQTSLQTPVSCRLSAGFFFQLLHDRLCKIFVLHGKAGTEFFAHCSAQALFV